LTQFSLYLLGAPRLEKDGAAVEFDTRKAMALLAFLAVSGKAHSRDTLAALLWGDYSQSNARAALRRTLSVVQRALGGEGVLEVRREDLKVAPDAPLWQDVTEFHRHLKACQAHGHADSEVCPRCIPCLSEMVRLYQGDFMAGFSLRDCPEFDNWQFYQSDSLRRELGSVLERLARGLAVQRDYPAAIIHARRLLAMDALHEPAHRLLMQLYAWAGQPAAALRQYQECVHILDRELGVPPMQETSQLYEEIKDHRLAPPRELEKQAVPIAPSAGSASPTVKLLPFMGRERELAELEKRYSKVKADGYFLVLEGEAGIGKTRLAEEFLQKTNKPSACTISAHCYSGEAYLAFAPFIEALRAGVNSASPDWHHDLQAGWITEAARLLPELRRLQPDLPPAPSLESPGAQVRFFEGISQTLLKLCDGSSPGVLFFDDVQWADEASLDLLTYLVRRLQGRRLFILAAWRSEDIPAGHRLHLLLGEARRTGHGSSIALPRLSAETVQQLVRASPGEKKTSQTIGQRLFEETEGLPYFISEYLTTASLDSDWNMPQGVRDILLSRLEAVDEGGRQLLQTAAVIGRMFEFETLLEASGRSEEETATSLDGLVRSGLIREGSPLSGDLSPKIVHRLVYDFSHDKMRSLVYEETNQGRRRLLHQRVAEGLLRRTHGQKELRLVAAQIAYHFRQSGRSVEAARYSKLAGEHARSLFANAEALAHYQIALALDHPDRLEIQEAIGDLYTLLGQYESALASYQSATQHDKAESQDQGRLQHKMGTVYNRLGEWEQAEKSFQAAESALPAGSDACRSRLYADWSLTAQRRNTPERAQQLATRALELAENANDSLSLAQAHNILGILAGSRGDLELAIQHLEHSHTLADRLASPDARVAALNNLSQAYAQNHEIERALQFAHTALEYCVQYGDRHHEAALHNNLADLYHAAGQTELSMAHLKQAVIIFSEIGADERDRLHPEIWKLTEW
jgi:predicted ATPase/DNA-binding SARP family transcriptional activator